MNQKNYDFKDIFDFEKIEKYRLRQITIRTLKIIFGVITFIVINILLLFNIGKIIGAENATLEVLFILFVITCLILFGWIKSSIGVYSNTIKNDVVKILIETLDSNIKYTPSTGISETTYKNSTFKRGYNKFESFDGFSGTFDDVRFDFSYVSAYRQYKSQRETKKINAFNGLFFCMTFPSQFQSSTTILTKELSNSLFNNLKQLQPEDFTLDKNFNEKFKLYTDNKSEKDKILQSNLIDYLIELQDNGYMQPNYLSSKKIPEGTHLSWNNNKIYFGYEGCCNFLNISINVPINQNTLNTYRNEIITYLEKATKIYKIIEQNYVT